MIEFEQLEEGTYLVEIELPNNNGKTKAIGFIKGKAPFLNVVFVYDGRFMPEGNVSQVRFLRKLY